MEDKAMQEKILKIIEKHEKFWSKPIKLKKTKIYPKRMTLETKEFFKIIQFHILFALYLLKYEIEGMMENEIEYKRYFPNQKIYSNR
jgi:hypothetical protein